MDTTPYSRDCSEQSPDESSMLTTSYGIDGRSVSDCSLLFSGVRHGDTSDSSSCPVGLHSGSTPLAGVGTIPGVAMTERGALQEQIDELTTELEHRDQRITELESATEQRQTEQERLREKMVVTAAVERVLIGYGLDADVVDQMLDDIEAVDSQLWGEDNV